MASLFPLDRKRFLQNGGANVLLALSPLEVQKKKKNGRRGHSGHAGHCLQSKSPFEWNLFEDACTTKLKQIASVECLR